MDKSSIIINNINDSIQLRKSLLSNHELIKSIADLSERIIETYKKGGKVLFCGNGGSAADAQHLAAELAGRYYYDRPPLFAEALHTNTSSLTSLANDYSYDEVFARLVMAMGNKGDLLFGLSTSGNSRNVINAMKQAQKQEMITVGLTRQGGGEMKNCCDIILEIPSTDTPRIQECHMLLGHSICQIVEQGLFPE